MRTLRYFLRLVVAFIGRFKGLIFLGISLGLISFFIIRIVLPKILNSSSSRIGLTGRYQTDNLPDFIVSEIGSGLTKINNEGLPDPALASDWQTPDKGKTWIFNIKSDYYWQDKTAVTSDDINYNFEDAEIERPNQRSIVFKLKNAYSPFPSVVAKPVFKKGLLGTGEWQVDKISISSNVIQYLAVKKKNQKITYKFYPTEDKTKLAFKLGEIDTMITIFDPSPFDSWNNVEIKKSVDEEKVVTLFFNTKDKTVSEKNLRQALMYAIDKNEYSANRAISPISPNSFAYNPQVKRYDQDLDRTKELINDLPDEIKKSFPIRLVSTPLLLPYAEKIAKQWKDVGIDTVVQVSSIIPSDFQVYIAIFEIPKDPDQYSLWHSTQEETNISGYSNPRIDKLLEDGRVELNVENRKKIYLDFQRFLLEDLPAGFLYHPIWYTISRK